MDILLRVLESLVWKFYLGNRTIGRRIPSLPFRLDATTKPDIDIE